MASTNTSENQVKPVALEQNRFRLNPKRTVFLFGAASAVCGLAMIQLQGFSIFATVMLVFFFAMMIVLRSSWMLTTVLALFLLMGPAFGIDATSAESRIPQLEINDLAFAFLILVFTGTSLRFLEIHRYNLAYFSEFGASKEGNVELVRRFPAILSGRWFGILVAFTLALILLKIFPLDPAANSKYWIKPSAMRVIFLMGALFLIWFIVRGVFALISRWQMDSDQASVMMRSVFANEHWTEHRGIESRLKKINQKNN